MLLSLVYFAMRCLLQALVPSVRSDFEREVEVLVLRHQLEVLAGVGGRACGSGRGPPRPRDAGSPAPRYPGPCGEASGAVAARGTTA